MNNKNTLIALQNKVENDKSYIVFRLNSNKYAIDIQNVLEVINLPLIEMPSFAPKGVVGFFDYKGNLIKVIDICPFLNIPTNKFSANDKMIVVACEDTCFALHTSNIENIIKLDKNSIQPLPYKSDGGFISSVCKFNEELISVIDIDNFVKCLNKNEANNNINYTQLMPVDEVSTKVMKLKGKELKDNNEVFAFPFNLNTLNQYIMFQLEEQNYFLDLKYVKEFVTINSDNITPLPYTQNYIEGLVNIRGEFLVVLNLKNYLGSKVQTEKKLYSKIIVVEGKNFNLALLVDDIKYIKNLKQYQILNINNSVSKYISSEFEENGELFSILDFEKVISDEKLYIEVK